MLNKNEMSEHLKIARLVLLSKKTSPTVRVEDICPIAILPHVTKVLETAIKNELLDLESKLLNTGAY